MERLLDNAGKRARQHLFLYALTASNFNASEACRKVNISRKTFENWVTTEPEFGQLIDEMHWHKKNFFESALVGLIRSGDSSATIFANRTLNRDRGYNEKFELEVKGQVNHAHAHIVQIDDLNLPIKVRRLILEAMRDEDNIIPIEVEHAGNGRGNGHHKGNGKSNGKSK